MYRDINEYFPTSKPSSINAYDVDLTEFVALYFIPFEFNEGRKL